MKNNRYILLIQAYFTLLIIISCKFDDRSAFEPRLPVANNSTSNTLNDSCVFSIKLRDTSVIISNKFGNIRANKIDDIDQVICNEITNKHIDTDSNYPINLLLDSVTPLHVYDKLVETLKCLGLYSTFLKTKNHGFRTVYEYEKYEINNEVIKLYGNKYRNKRYIFTECDTKKNEHLEDYPPPPPPPPVFSGYHQLVKNPEKLDSFDCCIIEKQQVDYTINAKTIHINDLISILGNKKFILIKLYKYNTYNDLIKLIDIIAGLNNKKFDYISQAKYNKAYKMLSADLKYVIKRENGVKFKILSLAEQNYIDNLVEKSNID